MEGNAGEPMFELSMELSPLKRVHERAATSFLFLAAIMMGGAIFIYLFLDMFYRTFSMTQGSQLAQTMLWSLY